ncbi:MAG: GIY-YIG nuclease family protein, partial [Anaerolineales bacterium]
MNEQRFPSAPGQYLLLLHLDHLSVLEIGKMGTFSFPPGTLIYIGSAYGPGGLSARLTRHLRPANQKKPHWHIDHLLSAATIHGIGWSLEPQHNECDWSASLDEFGSRWPRRFGASDCHCEGHLIQVKKQISIPQLISSIPDQLLFKRLDATSSRSSWSKENCMS